MNILYDQIDNIDKIILFSPVPNENDNNQHIFGCLLRVKNGYYLFDKIQMTAERRPREYEIQAVINNIIANGLEDKTFTINHKVEYTGQKSSVDAVNTILSQNLTAFNEKSFIQYLCLVRGSALYIDISEYLNDFGESTFRYIFSDLDEINVKFNEDFTLATITPSKKTNIDELMKQIMDKIHYCIDSTIEKNNAYIARTFYLGRGVEYFAEKNEKQIEIKRKILKSVVEDT